MFGVILIVCIAILASLTTFISSAGKIIDKRRKGLNYITRYGWFTISFNLTIIFLSIVQFVFNERELKKNQIASNIKQVKRDSISKSYYDSSLLVIKSKLSNRKATIKIKEV